MVVNIKKQFPSKIYDIRLGSIKPFFFFRERDVPSYGVYIVAYEWILEYLYPDQKRPLPTPFETVWVGGVAG
mgnify:CR=1 FL=1